LAFTIAEWPHQSYADGAITSRIALRDPWSLHPHEIEALSCPEGSHEVINDAIQPAEERRLATHQQIFSAAAVALSCSVNAEAADGKATFRPDSSQENHNYEIRC
jgi:hypothetical protein